MRGITDMDGHKATLKNRKMVWSGGKSSWMSDCRYNYHLRQYENITKTRRWSMMPHLSISTEVAAPIRGNQVVQNITSKNPQETLLVASAIESKVGNAHLGFVGREDAPEKRKRDQPSDKPRQSTTSFSINNNLWNGPRIVSTTSLKPGEFHNQRKATSKGMKLGNVANNSVRKASPAAAPLKLPVEPVPKSMLEAGKYNGFPSWDEVIPNPPKRFLSGMMSEAVLLTPQSAQRQPQISLRNMDKIEAYRTENPGSNLTFSWQIRDSSVKDADAIAAVGRLRQLESGYLLTKSVDPLPGGCADEVVLGF